MSVQLCLTWNNYVNHMMHSFRHLLSNQLMVDVTLACDGMSLKAHKLVLSACSPFFLALFLENPSPHPIVILKDVKYTDMKILLNFIYFGKVNVSENQFLALKKTAEILKVRAVFEATAEKIQSDELSQPSVSRSDEPPSKRRKRRSRKSSLNDQSDGRASGSGNSDSDVEEVYSSKLPSANETHPPEVENSSVVPTIPLLEETLQNNISMQEDQSSVQSILEQRRQPQSSRSNTPSTRPMSAASNSTEIASQQPECSAGNVPVQDDLMASLKEVVKTLRKKGILPTTDENGQSVDVESADEEPSRSTPDIEIITEDSDIEEITQDEVPRQEQMVQLDDDEPILTDVIPSPIDSSQQTNNSAFNNQHVERSSEISKKKRFTEKENNQFVEELSNKSISQGEPPSKRRKRRKQKASKCHRSTREVSEVDSDVEVISNEPSSSSSTASRVVLKMIPRQPKEQCPAMEIFSKVRPNRNVCLEANKLPEITVTTNDLSITSATTLNVKSSCQTQQQYPVDDKVSVQNEHSVQPNTSPEKNLTSDVPSSSSSMHPSTQDSSNVLQEPLSSTEVDYEHPESASSQLVVQDLLQELVAQASRMDASNDGVSEFSNSD